VFLYVWVVYLAKRVTGAAGEVDADLTAVEEIGFGEISLIL